MAPALFVVLTERWMHGFEKQQDGAAYGKDQIDIDLPGNG